MLGVETNVIFMGNMPNDRIMKEVSTKRLLLMASTTEGFPTSIAEAFSVGVPVVTTAVGSVATVVENGVNGCYLSKDFDDMEYVKCIENVFADYPHYVKGALESAQLFNAERVTKGVIDDIHTMIGWKKS